MGRQKNLFFFFAAWPQSQFKVESLRQSLLFPRQDCSIFRVGSLSSSSDVTLAISRRIACHVLFASWISQDYWDYSQDGFSIKHLLGDHMTYVYLEKNTKNFSFGNFYFHFSCFSPIQLFKNLMNPQQKQIVRLSLDQVSAKFRPSLIHLLVFVNCQTI